MLYPYLFVHLIYNCDLCAAPNVYKIPTVLGGSKEGPIRSAPAYSMAGRERDAQIPTFILPGPGYYDGEYRVTKSKPPVYSMRGKYKYLCDDNKPGPGAHCPEKVMNCVIQSIHSDYILKLALSTGRSDRHPRYLLALSIRSSQADRDNIYCRTIIRVVCEQIDPTKTIRRRVDCNIPLSYISLQLVEYQN